MKRTLIGAVVACLVLASSAASSACAVRPLPNELIGRVIIPKIHVNIAVEEGTPDDAAVPGYFPVHYRSTNLPGEGQAIVISAHHFTHALPGATGGPFLHLDQLLPGDSVYLSRYSRFGGGKYRYIVTSNRTVDCGHTPAGFKYCQRALDLLKNFEQTKVYLITCIGDGYQRRIVTAFAVNAHQP
jgi:LPXTG-site transpeptidase (sortase) family protein